LICFFNWEGEEVGDVAVADVEGGAGVDDVVGVEPGLDEEMLRDGGKGKALPRPEGGGGDLARMIEEPGPGRIFCWIFPTAFLVLTLTAVADDEEPEDESPPSEETVEAAEENGGVAVGVLLRFELSLLLPYPNKNDCKRLDDVELVEKERLGKATG
jgi:hypothetical protein